MFPYTQACLQGWTQFQTECYLLNENSFKNWYEAEIDCLNRNSDLVYILTIEEDHFLDSQLSNKASINDVFVGLKEGSGSGNRFPFWSNGDSTNYTNWQVNPTAVTLNGSACVAKSKSGLGQWAIVDCLQTKPYICKRRGIKILIFYRAIKEH